MHVHIITNIIQHHNICSKDYFTFPLDLSKFISVATQLTFLKILHYLANFFLEFA